MLYRPCGLSGLKLPLVSLGLWHNFGHVDSFDTARTMVLRAFDLGITHFDLANNYGPPPGSAEENFGKILKKELQGHRDEIIISSKAGYRMWDGPYGDGGSRKYLIASLDQSLRRMGLAYVDIFYHHRPDPDTPLEESMAAIQKRVNAPFLLDQNSLARQRVDLKKKLSLPKANLSYARILDKLLSQVKCKIEVRLDEADKPFVWVTTLK